MIKQIKVILQKQIATGGLSFTVVEMVPSTDPANPFPVEQPLNGATVTILKDGVQVLKGWTDQNGMYQEPVLPVGGYSWKVELAGYGIKQGTETVEA